MSGGRMVTMPLLESNHFLPDYGQISDQDAAKAKLMFINYPNNPTAACATEDFYKETIEFAAKHNIVAASDFAYGAIGFEGKKPLSFLQFEGAKEVGVEFYTLSKTYNMAGWRVGFALGNPEIIRMINLIQDHYYVSLFGAIQAAAAEALTQPQDSVKQLVRTYENRRNVLFEACKQIGWEAKPSQGSFFAWLPVPKGHTSVSFADLLLDKAKVVVAPGIGFGSHGDGYVRLGLLAEEKRIQEAVQRIGKLGLWN
jgi:aminotransferase